MQQLNPAMRNSFKRSYPRSLKWIILWEKRVVPHNCHLRCAHFFNHCFHNLPQDLTKETLVLSYLDNYGQSFYKSRMKGWQDPPCRKYKHFHRLRLHYAMWCSPEFSLEGASRRASRVSCWKWGCLGESGGRDVEQQLLFEFVIRM